MRTLNTIIRWIVGGLFIFSGLVKVNDPVGTSIKLHEYFDLFAVEFAPFFEAFIPYTLPIAVFIVVLEVALGVAVLVKFKMRFTLWVLLLMIVFFTFLTGYSHFTGKVTDCGCFGDAIPLTPYQSFIKDIILAALIGWLFVFRSRFLPAFGMERLPGIITGIATIISFWLAIAAVRHLPFIDFRAYKKGVNIEEAMQPTGTAEFMYVMTDDEGETYELKQYNAEYQLDTVIQTNPEVNPKITDFSIWNNEGEFTQEVFTGVKLLIVVQDFAKSKEKGLNKLTEMATLIEEQGGQPMLLTSSDGTTVETYRHEYQLAFPYYFGDATVLKAVVRANPGAVLVKDGTVLGKWHWRDFNEAQKDIPKLLR